MRIRPERVANAIRKEISNIIHEELKDPRIGFTTITKVEITPDLKVAKIHYTVMGDDKARKSTEAAFKNATGFIRNLIGDRIKTRFTPELIFVRDKTYEYREKIDKILDKIHKEKKGE